MGFKRMNEIGTIGTKEIQHGLILPYLELVS